MLQPAADDADWEYEELTLERVCMDFVRFPPSSFLHWSDALCYQSIIQSFICIRPMVHIKEEKEIDNKNR